ncbi:MAG: hypothetical protein QXH43_07435 [Metallosphaera sp.]|uniref:hypothetical protein n=1 Tax=Metallosphaera sp. TaxID=2020860 RepID=UPI00317346D0
MRSLRSLGEDLRPEDYANEHLRSFKGEFKFDESSVHDARVDLRKYYVIVEVTYPLHRRYELISLGKRILRRLGVVRDYDVHGCPKIERDSILGYVSSKADNLGELPKLYGSRFVVMENLVGAYKSLASLNDFHSVRKALRRARIMADSLGFDTSTLKEIVTRMGDERDRIGKEICEGRTPRFELNLSQVKTEGVNALREILLSDHEFKHVRRLIS